eukprot:g1024.t1
MSTSGTSSSDKVVAITGACGFLGGLVKETCDECGYTSIGIDLAVPKSQFEGYVSAEKTRCSEVCDISSKSAVATITKIFIEHKVDTVVHLAGCGNPNADFTSQLMPANVQGTYNVLEAARSSGTVNRVLFASSNHAFIGDKTGTIANQDDDSLENRKLGRKLVPGVLLSSTPLVKTGSPYSADSLYGVSKVMGEQLCQYFSVVLQSFHVISLRIGWCLYDDPYQASRDHHPELAAYLRSVWLSKEDFKGFVRAALQKPLSLSSSSLSKSSSPTAKQHLKAFLVSMNSKNCFDMTATIATLGYQPKDNSETFWEKAAI